MRIWPVDFRPPVTAEQKAEEFATWPDQVAAIHHASTSAATAYRHEDRDQARYWTEVGLRLSLAAGREPGGSLTELADTLRVGISD